MFDKNQLDQFYRYCVVLTKDKQNAFDLLQTSLEKYLRHTTGNIVSKNNYMRKIIRNEFFDQYKNNSKIITEEFDENIVTDINDRISSLEDILINRDEIKIIWNWLDINEREIMYLWAIQGYSTTEIAEQMGIPKGTIVSKISRLRKKVLKKIAENFEHGVL